MEIPASKWYRAIKRRRSRRQFEPRPLESKILVHINSICNDFQPFPDARAVFVADKPETVFKGAIGPYGKVKNAPAFVAFIGNMRSLNVQEHVGYMGEGIILEAESMNLATCWVAGFFRRKAVESLIKIFENERVMAITPIGYAAKRQSFEEKLMTGFGLTHKRKKLSGLVTGINESEWPNWIKISLEAARLAPSAVNRQPWRFHIEPDSITVSVNVMKREYGISKRLCCGIAMLHIETAALNCGMKGHWEFLKQPQVAKYAIDTKRGGSK
ncbi:nitroreductase family protein [Chloroflexota bacterium]